MPLLHFSHTLTGEGTELRMGFCIVLLLIGFCALGDSLLGKVVEIPGIQQNNPPYCELRTRHSEIPIGLKPTFSNYSYK